MKPSQRFGALLFLFVIATSPDSSVFAEDNELAYDLVGLWEAHKSFAPRFEGKLIVGAITCSCSRLASPTWAGGSTGCRAIS